jgi:hypothetical protein
MPKKNLYEISFSSATALDMSMVQTYNDFPQFLRIKEEMNRFMLNLNYSSRADCTGQQIHYLFVALLHLDNVEREIRISDAEEEIIRLEKIYDRIRSLKRLILEYIRQLTAQG